jgi:signal peptidase I
MEIVLERRTMCVNIQRMSWIAAAFGLFAPAAYQALTGRWRAALVLCGLFLIVVALTLAWPPLLWSFLAVLLGSVMDAARAARRGARIDIQFLGFFLVTLAFWSGVPLLVRRYVVESFRVPSTSMAPTLTIGDYFVAEKLSLHWSAPARGEVVVFAHPRTPEQTYVMRIVAVAGDSIAVRNHAPVVNGAVAARTLIDPATVIDSDISIEATEYEEHLGKRHYRIRHKTSEYDFPGEEGCVQDFVFALAPSADLTACVVPEGMVFVLGDDRWNSNDSRYWGAVPVRAITGRVRGIWLPGKPQGHIEWSRLGFVR